MINVALSPIDIKWYVHQLMNGLTKFGISYNGMLFSHWKEQSMDTCYNMDEPWKHYAKRKWLVTKLPCIMLLHLYEISQIDYSIEAESI